MGNGIQIKKTKYHQNRIAFIGAGLSTRISCLRAMANGNHAFQIFESERCQPSNQTWSFFESNVSQDLFEILKPIINHKWNEYIVRFQNGDKSIKEKYYSIRSEDLFSYCEAVFPKNAIQYEAKIDNSELKVSNATTRFKDFDFIFDTRPDAFWSKCGYQKFVGLDIEYESEHKLKNPIIMDASIHQADLFRFYYVLPLNHTKILVEQTQYSLNSELDFNQWTNQVMEYASQFGKIKCVERKESGKLPLPYRVNKNLMSIHQHDEKRVFKLGVGAGFVHPITGYSMPIISNSTLMVQQAFHLDNLSFAKLYNEELMHWNKQIQFYLRLNQILFEVASPSEAYNIFKQFYGLPNEIISRFYSAKLNAFDKIKFFNQRPPVSIYNTIVNLMSGGI